ncbi:DUF1398 domain-containing protein [Mycobacterium canetti]|uniref:DUF1398 domain-containing protein n=1 Tax=Mycobacterium canetti TaxID=78331 RepID=UPI0002A571E9|nr:DUF1398 family protein [Mycobacterium canetti]CCK60103.1 Conserved protein of unknown function [Mycobacterium canettii CIPT 140070010]
MSAAITNLQAAQRDAITNRPPVNGFPYLAETLRRAGVRTNTWWLPAMQSLYETDYGPVLDQGVPLIDGMAEVPAFDRAALVTALRADQAGQTSFREFAASAWRAGVLRYVVDLENRTCTYFGMNDQTHVERYAAVEPYRWCPDALSGARRSDVPAGRDVSLGRPAYRDDPSCAHQPGSWSRLFTRGRLFLGLVRRLPIFVRRRCPRPTTPRTC